MSIKAPSTNTIEGLEDLPSDSNILLQKVKDAYDYYYRYKTKDEIAILFKKIVVVLRKTPVSMKDDVNHKIRNCCFQIIKKMTLKASLTEESAKEALNLLFNSFSRENEVNGVTIVQILSLLTRNYGLVTEDVADQFIQNVETNYRNFYISAKKFLYEQPIDNPPMPSNFTNNTFSSSSSSIEVDPSIPFISTGSSSDTRQRSRSLSVDYITQPNSVIKRKSSTVITNMSITRIQDSILVLDKVLSIVLNLFMTFHNLIPRHQKSLLESLLPIIHSPVFELTSTTPKQYIQYIRVLCHSLSYFVVYIKNYKIDHAYLEDVAKTIIDILTNYPAEFISSSDMILIILHRLIDGCDVKTLKEKLPLLTGPVLFPPEVYLPENCVFAEHRLNVIRLIVAQNVASLSFQDIQCVVNLYASFISNDGISYHSLLYFILQFKDFISRMKTPPFASQELISSILYSMLSCLIRKLEDLHFVIENEAKTRTVKKISRERDVTNARFNAFMKDEPYSYPVVPYDEYGIRISSAIRYYEIGDIIITEPRFNIISLSQTISSVLRDIITVVILPLNDTTAPQSRSTIHYISYDHLVEYFCRYVISICHYGEIFQVDESRSKDQIVNYISKFAEVIMELPDDIARQVLSLTINTIYDTIKQYPLYVEFFYSLIHNQKSFRYTASLFIDLVCNHLYELDIQSKEPPALYHIFRYLCAQLSIASREEGVMKPYFRKIITECFRWLVRTTNWTYYLDFLFGCLSIFQHSSLPDLSTELDSILKFIIPELLRILQINYSPLIRERILEIANRIPYQKHNIQWLYSYLLSFYMKGLVGPDSLQKTAISALDSILMREEVVYLLQMDNNRSSLMSSLQLIIHTSSNQSLAQSAISLLGRLGGKTRSSLKDHIDLPFLLDEAEQFSLLLPNGNEILFDYYIELLLQFLHRNLIFSSYTKSDQKLCSSIRCSLTNITSLREIRIAFKKRAISAIHQLLFGFSSNSYFYMNPSIYYSLDTIDSLNTITIQDDKEMLSTEDRCFCMLVYSLLLGCCDIEVKEQALESLHSFIQFIAGILVQYAIPNTNGISYWPLSSFSSQDTIDTMIFGPSFTPLPFILAIPPNQLSPLAIAHSLLHLLEREDTFYSDVVIDVLHTLHDSIQSLDPDRSTLLQLIFDEYFFAIFFREYITGGWRLKMNIMPVLVDWCKQAPILLLQRYSSLFIHYIFNINEQIPAEYSIVIKNQSEELLSYLFAATYHIHLNPSIEVQKDIQIDCIKEDEEKLYALRVKDSIQVLIDYLLTFYSLCQQLACSVVDTIIKKNENPEYSTLLLTELQKRQEFEKVDRLPSLRQISVYVTMELALQWQAFTANQKVTHIVLQEALRFIINNSGTTPTATNPSNANANATNPAKNTLRELLSKNNDTGNPLKDALPPSIFYFSYSIEFQLFLIILRLACTYYIQRQQLPADDPVLKEYASILIHVEDCIAFGCGCNNDCVLPILTPVLHYLDFSRIPCFTNCEEVFNRITKGCTVHDVSLFELIQIERIAPYYPQQEKLAAIVLTQLRSISESIENQKVIQDIVLQVTIHCLQILSQLPIPMNFYFDLFDICSSLLSSFSINCFSFGSTQMIYQPLSTIILHNKKSFLQFLFCSTKHTPSAEIPSILSDGLFISLIAMMQNDHYKEFALLFAENWADFCNYLNTQHNKTAWCTILKTFYESIQSKDVEVLYSLEVQDFFFSLWSHFSTIIEGTTTNHNMKTNYKQAIITGYKPVFYEENDLVLFDITTKILIHIMRYHYNPILSNKLSFAYCHHCQLSFHDLSDYYQKELPRLLTEEQRRDTLLSCITILHDPMISDTKKENLIIHSIIPLISTTCNNKSLDLSIVFIPSFFDDYVAYFSNLKQENCSTSLLVAILQLNTLLIKYLTSFSSSFVNKSFIFGKEMYRVTDDSVFAYALLFLCQFLNYQNNKDLTTVLFVNIIHSYNNKNLNIIYRASNLLEKPLLEMEEKDRSQLRSRVLANMQMNEHILDEQIHIWRLIIQHAEFFYTNGDSIFYNILSNSVCLSFSSSNHRELYLDIFSLVTAFYLRKQREKQPINIAPSVFSHLLITVALDLVYILTLSNQESFLFHRGCELLSSILTLRPQEPFSLDKFDSRYQGDTRNRLNLVKDDNGRKDIMPIIVSFKITVKSLPQFHNRFVEINAENLKNKILQILTSVHYNYVFCSLIELLPELFAEKTSEPSSYDYLYTAIRDKMSLIIKNDIPTISPDKSATRSWRILYLIEVIVNRNPSVLSLFLPDILEYIRLLLDVFKRLSKDPNYYRVLYNQNVDLSKMISFATENLGLPKMPILRGNEVIYSLLLLIKLLAKNMKQLDDNSHNNFIRFICDFFQNVQRAELLTTVLVLIREWVESEEEIVTVKDISMIISKTNDIRSLPESVLYICIITEYWNFIYAVCIRYASLLQTNCILAEQLQSSIFSGMVVTNPIIRKKFRSLLLPSLPEPLYNRLQFLFSETHCYANKKLWLPLFVEVLIRSNELSVPLRYAISMKHFPEIKIHSNEEKGNVMNKPVNSIINFINQASLQPLDSIIEDFIELSYADMRFAYSLWNYFFPLAWSSLTTEQQITLTSSISKFLASDLHFSQLNVTSSLDWEDFDRNYKLWGSTAPLPYTSQVRSSYGTIPASTCLHALLDSLLRCNPLPHFSPSLLVNLADNYGCGPQVSLLLEAYLKETINDKEKSFYVKSLQKVYLIMNEDDAYASSIRSLPVPEFRNGMTLERYNKAQAAQLAYFEGLRNTTIINSIDLLNLLQERWKACALNLRQWKLLFEYGKLNRDILLLLDCFGKNNIWDSYPRLFNNFSLFAEKDLMKPQTYLLSDRYNILHPGKTHPFLSDVLLPIYRKQNIQPIAGYDSILQYIHQANDLNVSRLLLACNTTRGLSEDANHYLKLLNSYMINPWDPLSIQEDLIIWKYNVYCHFLKRIPAENRTFLSPQIYQLRLSRSARLLGLPEVSVEYLTSMTPESTLVFDTEKWRERVLVAIELGCHDVSILNDIEHLQYESLKENQKTSIQYTKGCFYMKEATKQEDAIKCFNAALSVDAKNMQAIEKLGKIYYDRWKDHGDYNDACQCLKCCYNQIRATTDLFQVMVRFFHIVFYSLDNQNIVNYAASLFQGANKLPNPSIWIPYLPFLFSRPSETQITIFNNVIIDLTRKYPFVVFYPLLTLCQSLGMATTSPYAKPTTLFNGTISCSIRSSKPTDVISLANATYYFSTLLYRSSSSPSQLLLFINTLHAIPHDPYRELLASLDRILRTIYSEISMKGPSSLKEPVSQDLRSRLSNLCYITFNTDNMIPSTFSFIQMYSTSFLHDFSEMIMVDNKSTNNPAFAKTLEELLQRLLIWKTHMKECIAHNDIDRLYSTFFSYNQCLPSIIEIPGQRISVSNTSQNYSLLQSLKSHIPILYKEHHNWRHVDMIDEQHRVFRFYLEQVNSVDLLIEERTLYYQFYFDCISSSSHAIQMRHLHSSLPHYVNISSTLRLVGYQPEAQTLEGIYQEVLADQYDEKQFDFAMKLFFLNHSQTDIPSYLQDWHHSISKDTLFSSVTTSDLLSRYIFSHLPSPCQFYAFRSEFVKQYAYIQFMQRLFASPNDHPDKIMFSLKTGDVLALNIHSNYIPTERRFAIVDRSAVPLRFTRNITDFLSASYEGAFELAFGSLALTFKRELDIFTGYSRVFERENVRLLLKPKNMNERDVKESIITNVNSILSRGLKYAPNVDVKFLESMDDVDKEIREAVRISKDVNYLTKASPSFCAWF